MLINGKKKSIFSEHKNLGLFIVGCIASLEIIFTTQGKDLRLYCRHSRGHSNLQWLHRVKFQSDVTHGLIYLIRQIKAARKLSFPCSQRHRITLGRTLSHSLITQGSSLQENHAMRMCRAHAEQVRIFLVGQMTQKLHRR